MNHLKGYGFPSDLGSTETWTTDAEAVNADEEIIAQNMKIVQQLIEDEKIPYRSTLKTNASIDEVSNMAETAELIVVDENFDKPVLLGDDKISLNMLRSEISKPLEVVAEKKPM